MLVHELIFAGQGDHTAFDGKTPVSYHQLQKNAAKYRAYFQKQGIQAGDAVGLMSRNCVEFVYSYMAIVSLGAVIVPLNFQLTAREIAYIVKDAQMKTLITAEELPLAPELERYGHRTDVAQLVLDQVKAAVNDEEAVVAAAKVDEEDPCAIIYTSGTTGNPKGAVLTHKNLISNAQAFKQVLSVSASDHVLCVLPMYHCFAWTCAVLNALLCGASITILETFAPKETLAVIKEAGITVMYGVPPMYNYLSRVGSAEDLAGVRLFVSGGASLPEKIAEQFHRKYGVHIVEGYGLSEASPVVALNPPQKVKYCSIGKALPGLTVRVINEKGEIVPPGTVGELVVRGPSVMKEYFHLPLETSVALRDNWLHTGDLAYQDKEGYFFIVDRLKDMIVANGENIYPREIEELLYTYPGITEAAVIGVPDELRGQVVRAYVVMGEDHVFNKKALKEYLQGKLAPYKIPKEFILVDALPKNQTGKILKRVLREQFQADYESAEIS